MHPHPPGGDAPRQDFGPLRLPLGPTRRPARLLLLLPTVAALALAAAGCGGGSGGSTSTAATSSTSTSGTASSLASGKATTLQLKADASGALKFDKSTLTANAGKVTIVMDNPSPLSHDVAIQGNGVDVKGKVVGQGGTSTVTADLKPGTYTFLCTVDGHAAAGMKGTLTVK
jgi:plastocyanin